MRLGPSGAPLEVEAVGHAMSGVQGLTTGDLVSLVDASRMGWLGIVETPDGGAGIESGDFGIPTPVLFATGSPAMEGNARASEGGFDGQGLFADHDDVFTSYRQQAAWGSAFSEPYPAQTSLGAIVIKRLPPTAIPLRPKRIPG